MSIATSTALKMRSFDEALIQTLPRGLQISIFSYLGLVTIPITIDKNTNVKSMITEGERQGHKPLPYEIVILNVIPQAHLLLTRMRSASPYLFKQSYNLLGYSHLRVQIVEIIRKLHDPENCLLHEEQNTDFRRGANALSLLVNAGNYLDVLKVYFAANPAAIWNKANNPKTGEEDGRTIVHDALHPHYSSTISVPFIHCLFESIRANKLEDIYLHRSRDGFTAVQIFKRDATIHLRDDIAELRRDAIRYPDGYYLGRIAFLEKLLAIEALIRKYRVPANKAEAEAFAAMAPASVSTARLREPSGEPRIVSTPSAAAAAIVLAPLPFNPAPIIPILQSIPKSISTENASTTVTIDVQAPLPTPSRSEISTPPVTTETPLAGRVTIESATEIRRNLDCCKTLWITLSKIARIVTHAFVTLLTRCIRRNKQG